MLSHFTILTCFQTGNTPSCTADQSQMDDTEVSQDLDQSRVATQRDVSVVYQFVLNGLKEVNL